MPVVIGTAAIRPIEPTSVATISLATTSLLTASDVDVPATHMGLDETAVLAGKYEQSAANFARVVDRHFDVVSTYPSYRAARRLKRVPGLGMIRPWFRRLALNEAAPVSVRAFSLRLYRAALYADRV